MDKIYDWKSHRSGSGQRVEGVDALGREYKVTRIATIEARHGQVVATHSDGTTYQLMLGQPEVTA